VQKQSLRMQTGWPLKGCTFQLNRSRLHVCTAHGPLHAAIGTEERNICCNLCWYNGHIAAANASDPHCVVSMDMLGPEQPACMRVCVPAWSAAIAEPWLTLHKPACLIDSIIHDWHDQRISSPAKLYGDTACSVSSTDTV